MRHAIFQLSQRVLRSVGSPAGYKGNEMAKQQTQTSAPAGNAARKAAQKPSKGVVSKPVDALQAVAATLGATPAPAAVQTPPSVVALRGQAAVQSVAIKAGAVYRTKAVHNMDWWAVITKATATGPATVADLTKAGVPSHFIGYTLRRGYLVAA